MLNIVDAKDPEVKESKPLIVAKNQVSSFRSVDLFVCNVFQPFVPGEVTDVSNGTGNNKPNTRKRAIFERLRNKPLVRIIHTLNNTTHGNIDLTYAAGIHTEQMLDVLKNGYEILNTKVEENTIDRSYLFQRNARRNGAVIPCNTFTPQMFIQDAEAKVIYAKLNSCCRDVTTPLYPSLAVHLHQDLEILKQAVAAIGNGTSRYAYVLNEHPGHHADARTFYGYCYLNYAAIAAQRLQAFPKYNLVGILDVDMHLSDGSHRIFEANPNVPVASIHINPEYDFPYSTRYNNFTGIGKATGTKFNYPLDPGTSWTGYKKHLEAAIQQLIVNQKVQVLVVSLGFDTLSGDPEAAPNSGLKLTPKDFHEMRQCLLNTDVPILFISEGGYNIQSVADAADEFFN